MVAPVKVPIVDEFTEMLGRSKSTVVAEYHGLTMKQLQILRKDLRKQGAEMKVVKNTLARLACQRVGMDDLSPELKGPLAFVLSYEDIVVGPKTALQFSRKHPKFKLRGGYAEGATLSEDEVKALGNLPSLEVLRGNLIMNIMGVPREFIQTLEARIEAMGGAPADEAAADAAEPAAAEAAAPTETEAPATDAAPPAEGEGAPVPEA
ncbi:MAG TPA: 50S ribosomal protein L10 [bacterium]|nr:50S ribosomal protein L10 [bacterium]